MSDPTTLNYLIVIVLSTSVHGILSLTARTISVRRIHYHLEIACPHTIEDDAPLGSLNPIRGAAECHSFESSAKG